MNLSLSSYKDTDVYYRAGDNSSKNLEPKFVAISKKNKANVNEASSTNNITNGKIIDYRTIYFIFSIKINKMI